MCFSFSHLLSFGCRFIYLHMTFFHHSLFHYFLCGIFHFLTSLCSLFISCNIFLLFFICFFPLLPSYEFLFLYFYVHFVNFMNGKIVFCLLPFSYYVNRRRDAKRLLAVLYFSSKNILRYYFHFPFYFLSFSHLFAFIYSFNLPFSSSSTFPSYSKQQLFAASLLPEIWRLGLGKSGVISLSSILRGDFPRRFTSTWRIRCKVRYVYVITCFRLNFSRFRLETVY